MLCRGSTEPRPIRKVPKREARLLVPGFLPLHSPTFVTRMSHGGLTEPRKGGKFNSTRIALNPQAGVQHDVTPAWTAPRQIEHFCSKQALHIFNTFWHRGDYEAFMANCIANHTPMPTGRRKYRKY